jgi:GntR family transcriptional regulator, transcriptional repressor for pyruvate dehydrogenase complex
MDSSPGPSKYRYNDVVARLQSMMTAGELPVGRRLPPERELARTFGVSRNCIRQAIQTLAQQHLLESRRGDGTYVCEPDTKALARSLAQAVAVNQQMLREIMEFRHLLEPQVAALAAENITPAQLDRLKILVCDQDRKILAAEDDAHLDVAFHLLLAEATGNRLIHQVFSIMQGAINDCRSGLLQSNLRRRTSLEAHLQLIDALEARDPEQAARVMREHLHTVARIIVSTDPPVPPPDS